MDRTGIIVVTLCIVLLGLWFIEQQKYAPPRPQPQPATNTATAAQTVTANSNAVLPPPNVVPVHVFDTNTPEELLVITNARARYTFTSRGGGLKSVELLDYPETVSPRWKKKVAKDGVATLNQRAPVPVLAILGDASLVGDGNFTLTQTADGVHAEKSLTNGLRLVEGIPAQLELPRERERAAGKRFGPTARVARAGMGRRHGDADGTGRQRP